VEGDPLDEPGENLLPWFRAVHIGRRRSVLVRGLLNGIVADLRDLGEPGHRAVMLLHARLGQTILLNWERTIEQRRLQNRKAVA
jgi:hypothetical protein